MPTSTAFLGLCAVALAMVLTPGPNMMYLVARSISQGRRAGIISLAGIAVGFLVYLVATTVGLSAVFSAVPSLYIAVKLAGAGYLLWLAFSALRPGGTSVFSVVTLNVDSPRRLFGMGLLTALLNPKIAVMYVSLIPQFENPAAGHVALQGFALGGAQICVSLTVNLLIVCTAGAIARFLSSRPTWIRGQRYVTGTLLGAVAVKLATDTSTPATA